MIRTIVLAVAVFATTGITTGAIARAEEKKPAEKGKPAFTGAWTRDANGVELEVQWVNKDTAKISASIEGNGLTVTLKYSVKDGVVKGKITKVEVKGDFENKPAKGLELSFKWTVKGGSATLEDLEGDGLEHAKPVVEGTYSKKK